jgi:hypothetical protein
MNTPETTQTPQKLTSYQNKLRLNRKYYHRKYENDPEFRQAEIDRNSERVLKKYHEDPEYRERVKQQALARYYRLKAQNSH